MSYITFPEACDAYHMNHVRFVRVYSCIYGQGMLLFSYKKLTKVVKRKGYMNPFTALIDLLDEYDFMGPLAAFVGVVVAIGVAYLTR